MKLADLKRDEEKEQFLEQYITNKLDYLEWTQEDEIKISPTMLEISREFLKLLFEDFSNSKEFNAVKSKFNHIANDIIFRIIEGGQITDEILEKTAEKCGVDPRRVKTIFEALKLAGWKPTQKPLRYKIFSRN